MRCSSLPIGNFGPFLAQLFILAHQKPVVHFGPFLSLRTFWPNSGHFYILANQKPTVHFGPFFTHLFVLAHLSILTQFWSFPHFGQSVLFYTFPEVFIIFYSGKTSCRVLRFTGLTCARTADQANVNNFNKIIAISPTALRDDQ